VTQWLDQPVEHIRDIRTELLLKLLLRRRRGQSLEPLLLAQHEVLAERFDTLGAAGSDADLVDLWRRENARAVRRFLDAALEQATGAPAPSGRTMLPLTARNQLRARITSVSHGDVLSSVKAQLPDGQRVTAVVTRDSLHDLDLAADDDVLVIIKSTEVMLASLGEPTAAG
jgi:molybdopterin-binding protein